MPPDVRVHGDAPTAELTVIWNDHELARPDVVHCAVVAEGRRGGLRLADIPGESLPTMDAEWQ